MSKHDASAQTDRLPTAVTTTLAPAFVEQLYRKADAARWGLAPAAFTEALTASVSRAYTGADPDARALEKYAAALHVADLALARACADGHSGAWDHFVLELRPALYRAADALDASGRARELADELYAELYGLDEGSGERRSLLRYFHGRSSLTTWLRAVLAQRHVDAQRAARRIAPLPDDDVAAAPAGVPHDPDRARLVPLVVQALHAAVLRLSARDRLRLRSYHVARMTLAAIGRITGEHEATVSRHLSRTRRALRADVERALHGAGLTDAQIARAFDLAVEDAGLFDLDEVFDSSGERKKPARDRSNDVAGGA